MIPARMLMFCTLALLGCLLAGCSKKSTTLNAVTGKVMYKGVPLTTGIIVFSPDTSRGESGKIAFSKIKEDGSYTLCTGDDPGAAAGWYRVTVAAMSAPSPSYQTAAVSLIDPKYCDPQLSQLGCEVKANIDNHLNFNLE